MDVAKKTVLPDLLYSYLLYGQNFKSEHLFLQDGLSQASELY